MHINSTRKHLRPQIKTERYPVETHRGSINNLGWYMVLPGRPSTYEPSLHQQVALARENNQRVQEQVLDEISNYLSTSI